jgi:hypothetical protein
MTKQQEKELISVDTLKTDAIDEPWRPVCGSGSVRYVFGPHVSGSVINLYGSGSFYQEALTKKVSS